MMKFDRDVRAWLVDVAAPVARIATAIAIAAIYLRALRKGISAAAIDATKALLSILPLNPPQPPALAPLIYFIHVAIPTGFVLVLLLSVIGYGRADNGTTSRPTKGLGWVWIVGVIGLTAPFALLLFK